MDRSQMQAFLASVADNFSLEVFDSLGLRDLIQTALDEGNGWEKKECVLKSPLVVVLVLLMTLHRNVSIVNVFKSILSTLRTKKERLSLTVMSEEALYHARARIGVDPMRILFEKTTHLVEWKANFHEFRTVAADGVHFTVPDTEKNSEAFGRPECGNASKSAFPQLKGVSLVSSETREVIAQAFGPYGMPEIPAVEKLIERYLRPLDLIILDRGLPSMPLFMTCNARGAHYLARISSAWSPRILKQFGPGDFLVEIRTRLPIEPGMGRQKNQTHYWAYMQVRMIVYTFESTGETIRLLTDLLDTKTYTALELAELYHERWEVELTYDELKTHLESIPHGTAPTVFRSQTPVGILQEAYGMLAIYNLTRHLMAKAAKQIRVPADQISFVGTLNVIKLAIPRFENVTDLRGRRRLERQLVADIADCKLDRPRRKRRYARVVRIKFIRFPKKRPEHHQEYFDFKAEIRLCEPRGGKRAA